MRIYAFGLPPSRRGRVDTPREPEPTHLPADAQDHVPRPCQKQPTQTDTREHSGDIRTAPELWDAGTEHGRNNLIRIRSVVQGATLLPRLRS